MISPDFDELLGDQAGDRRLERRVAEGLLERRDLRADDGHAGAGGVDFFAAGAGADSGERFLGRAHAALRRRHPVARHIAPRRRIVALLAGAGVGLEQGFEALEVLFGGRQLRLGRRLLGLGRDNLRFGLPHVFGPRAGLHQPHLRLGRHAFRLRAVNGQLHVARVERQDGLAGLHAVAFLDGERQNASARFRREPHLGRFDVARHPNAVGRRLFRTADRQDQHRDGEHVFDLRHLCHLRPWS